MDVPELWPRFRAVALAPSTEAWQALVLDLEPILVAIARRQPIGRLRAREDCLRDIATRVLERLHASGYAAIHKLCALEPQPVLRAWLHVLVRRSAIDYMRQHPEFERGTARREARWISLASLTTDDARAADPSSLSKRRSEVIAFMRATVEHALAEHAAHGDDALGRLAIEWRIARVHVRRLLDRGERYLAVLTSLLTGSTQAETAASLGITRREVELTVRYIEELLRARNFGGEP